MGQAWGSARAQLGFDTRRAAQARGLLAWTIIGMSQASGSGSARARNLEARPISIKQQHTLHVFNRQEFYIKRPWKKLLSTLPPRELKVKYRTSFRSSKKQMACWLHKVLQQANCFIVVFQRSVSNVLAYHTKL